MNALLAENMADQMRLYARRYEEPPYGREIDGTKELLRQAADLIEELSRERTRQMEEFQKSYDGLSQEARSIREELEEVNQSAIQFENKVERLLGKEALGIVMFGSKEAYERYQEMEQKLLSASTPAEKIEALAERMSMADVLEEAEEEQEKE